MSPYTIYEVEEDIFRLIEEGHGPSVQKEALFAIIARREPLDAFPVLNTLIELLESSDTRINAAIAIANTVIAVSPSDRTEIISALNEKAKKANEELLKGIEDANSRILQETSLVRTSSAGIVDDKEAIKSLFNALQSQGLTNKERTSIIESLRTRITDLFSYVGYTEQSMKNNAIDAIVEIRAVITSALNTIEETLVGKEYAGTMIDLVNNIESFRGRPFEVQPKDISPELYRELFGSLAIQGRNINSKAINNINLEAAEQNFEELQAQLKEAKKQRR